MSVFLLLSLMLFFCMIIKLNVYFFLRPFELNFCLISIFRRIFCSNVFFNAIFNRFKIDHVLCSKHKKIPVESAHT